MAVKHEAELKGIADHARAVATEIDQGNPNKELQVVVNNELRKYPPDNALQSIENQLYAVAKTIDAYLRDRTS
jgi:hypothetical protein